MLIRRLSRFVGRSTCNFGAKLLNHGQFLATCRPAQLYIRIYIASFYMAVHAIYGPILIWDCPIRVWDSPIRVSVRISYIHVYGTVPCISIRIFSYMHACLSSAGCTRSACCTYNYIGTCMHAILHGQSKRFVCPALMALPSTHTSL